MTKQNTTTTTRREHDNEDKTRWHIINATKQQQGNNQTTNNTNEGKGEKDTSKWRWEVQCMRRYEAIRYDTTQYDTAKHALYLAAAVATKQQEQGNNQTNKTNEGKGKKETSKWRWEVQCMIKYEVIQHTRRHDTTRRRQSTHCTLRRLSRPVFSTLWHNNKQIDRKQIKRKNQAAHGNNTMTQDLRKPTMMGQARTTPLRRLDRCCFVFCVMCETSERRLAVG